LRGVSTADIQFLAAITIGLAFIAFDLSSSIIEGQDTHFQQVFKVDLLADQATRPNLGLPRTAFLGRGIHRGGPANQQSTPGPNNWTICDPQQFEGVFEEEGRVSRKVWRRSHQ
jgi:hypothetical protein